MNQAFLEFPSWLSPTIIPGVPFFRWYGLMYVINILVLYWVVLRQIRTNKFSSITENEHFNTAVAIVIGVILGARLFSVLLYDTSGTYLRKPWLIFWPFDSNGSFAGLQGMSYHGGIVGAILGGVLYMLFIKKIKYFPEYMDICFAVFPLVYTLGRLGNFINGELFGRITTLPFGMRFPAASPLPISNPHVAKAAETLGLKADSSNLVNLPRHASQLYEAFFEGIVLWAFLWFIIRKKKSFHGFISSWYVIGYGTVRFFIEYFRQPDSELGFIIRFTPGDNPPWLFLSLWNFTMGQLLCVLMILGGVIMLYLFRSYYLKEPSIQTYRYSPAVKSRKIHQKIQKAHKKK